MIGPAIRYECSVDHCDWSLDVPPPSNPEWTGTGFRVTWTDQAAVEQVVSEHIATHTPMEFLRTIARLRSDLAARDNAVRGAL